jgi:hypothetical protein
MPHLSLRIFSPRQPLRLNIQNPNLLLQLRPLRRRDPLNHRLILLRHLENSLKPPPASAVHRS